MEKCILPYGRGPQILKCLIEHGPLTLLAFERLLKPSIPRRRLLDALSRLVKRGLIDKRLEPVFGTTFFRIKHCQWAWKKLSKILGGDPQSFNLPQFRYLDPYYSQACAVWGETFRRLWPEANVFRKCEISSSSLQKILLPPKLFHPRLEPDLLLSISREHDESRVTIGVLMEVDYRSDIFFAEKIKHYASLPNIDAILILACEWQLYQKAELVFKSLAIKEALRTKSVGANFVTFTIYEGTFLNSISPLINYDLKTVSLTDWMQVLSKFKTHSNPLTDVAIMGNSRLKVESTI